ncbi:YciI family protein [Streptomyces oceani]|uniref:YCII-related domain-containing protein n=1 Tax=Streptomyces oceani TaxID=1075402 RepID=A0A1E7KKA1_9ACTN|nr:YciI family protein [Streptomyces oceani]OEV04304.1 hypothetical protein AN216_08965 [Streptomyces oceani]
MKYLLMIQSRQSDYEAMGGGEPVSGARWTKDDIRAMVEHMSSLNTELAETGELIDAHGLAEPAQTRQVVGSRDGRPVLSDTPYGTSHEVLAGYWLLECVDIERATRIAARVKECPQPAGAPDYPVLVRPVPDTPPSPDE